MDERLWGTVYDDFRNLGLGDLEAASQRSLDIGDPFDWDNEQEEQVLQWFAFVLADLTSGTYAYHRTVAVQAYTEEEAKELAELSEHDAVLTVILCGTERPLLRGAQQTIAYPAR